MTSSQVSPAWASAGRAVSWAKVWLTRRNLPSRPHTARATGAVSRTAASRFDDVCGLAGLGIALRSVSRTRRCGLVRLHSDLPGASSTVRRTPVICLLDVGDCTLSVRQRVSARPIRRRRARPGTAPTSRTSSHSSVKTAYPFHGLSMSDGIVSVMWPPGVDREVARDRVAPPCRGGRSTAAGARTAGPRAVDDRDGRLAQQGRRSANPNRHRSLRRTGHRRSQRAARAGRRGGPRVLGGEEQLTDPEATKLVTRPSTSATTTNVSSLAVTTLMRCGTAVNVVRIPPVVYSPVITRAPRTPIAELAEDACPLSEVLVGSNVAVVRGSPRPSWRPSPRT